MTTEEPEPATREIILQAMGRVLKDSGRSLSATVADDATFSSLNLDSLDLAVLVVALEGELSVDPFRSGTAPVRTVGELVAVYVSAVADSKSS